MFSDMVGYTALVARDERQAYRLLEMQRRVVRRELKRHHGREVETIGDAFLVEFSSGLLAVECALSIQCALQQLAKEMVDEPPIELRIAVHLGDVEHPGRKVFGDAVNVASRLQALAPAGGIALSAPLVLQLRSRLNLAFRDLGVVPLKHVVDPPQVFTLDAQAIAEAGERDLEHLGLQRRDDPGVRRRLAWLLPALAASMLAVGIAWRWTPWAAPAPAAAPTAAAASGASVAVLPLRNLSGQPEDQYLVTGLHSEIIDALSYIRSLKVSSRKAVESYPADLDRTADIGRDLSVARVVDGSVQHAGGLYNISLRMRDADSGKTVWSQVYRRERAELPALQSLLVADIARQAQAKVTAEEEARFGNIPTRNIAAYEAYLKTRTLSQKSVLSPQEVDAIIAAADRALALDPQFYWPLEYQVLAHMRVYRSGLDASPERAQMTYEALAAMERLAPAEARTDNARGLYYALIVHDPVLAEEAFRSAIAKRPNSASQLANLGIALAGMDRIEEAAEMTRRALRLEPSDLQTRINLGAYLRLLREYPQEVEFWRELNDDLPGEVAIQLVLLEAQFQASGDLERFHAALLDLPLEQDPTQTLQILMHRSLLFGETEALMRWLDGRPERIAVFQDTEVVPTDLLRGWLLWIDGRTDAARACFERALPLLRADFEHGSDGGYRTGWMAVALSALGEPAKARAVWADLITAPRYDKPSDRWNLHSLAALAALMLGDPGAAIDELSTMLHRHSYVGAHYVAADRSWTGLRRDPRFRQLVGSVDQERGH